MLSFHCSRTSESKTTESYINNTLHVLTYFFSFEKMLYDQAQLAVSYLTAYQITKNQLFASAARDILDYVMRYIVSM
jgi:hypothetical protein